MASAHRLNAFFSQPKVLSDKVCAALTALATANDCHFEGFIVGSAKNQNGDSGSERAGKSGSKANRTHPVLQQQQQLQSGPSQSQNVTLVPAWPPLCPQAGNDSGAEGGVSQSPQTTVMLPTLV